MPAGCAIVRAVDRRPEHLVRGRVRGRDRGRVRVRGEGYGEGYGWRGGGGEGRGRVTVRRWRPEHLPALGVTRARCTAALPTGRGLARVRFRVRVRVHPP